MFKLDIREEDKFEQAELDVIKTFESPLDLIESRMTLQADLKDFNSGSLTMCRKMIEKAITHARMGKFDDDMFIKATDFLDKQYKIVEVATGDLNILAQIGRMYHDLEVIWKRK